MCAACYTSSTGPCVDGRVLASQKLEQRLAAQPDRAKEQHQEQQHHASARHERGVREGKGKGKGGESEMAGVTERWLLAWVRANQAKECLHQEGLRNNSPPSLSCRCL